ncbi:MAG: nitrous oxide reductase family maturation protein NosD [Bacillota bacterium]
MRGRLLVGVLLALLLLPVPALGADSPQFPIPPEPDPFAPSGRTLVVSPEGPYRSPAEALAAAAPGDTVEVRGGAYTGHLVVAVPVRLVGVDWPVLDGGGQGSVLTLKAPRVEVTGFLIRSTGQNLSTEDAAITVTGPGAYIHHNRIEEALFGVYLRKAHHSRVIANEITGLDEDLGLRGDAIRIWYSPVCLVEANRVEGGRDVIIWFSDQVVLRRNQITGSRYGLHFMWSGDGLVEENRLDENSVGIFVMYSSRVAVRRNLIRGSRGPSGYGLALKDAEYLTAEQNWITANRVGLYLDNSPYSRDAWNRFAENVVAGNEIGLLAMPATHDNRFARNDFLDNADQVQLTAGGALGPNTWAEGSTGNFWSDYAGYDRDGDGTGELPYQYISLFETMVARRESVSWFRHSPAAAAVDLAARAFPAVAPEPRLTDPFPAVRPYLAGGFEPPVAAEPDERSNLALVSLAMLGAAALAARALLRAGTRRRPRRGVVG